MFLPTLRDQEHVLGSGDCRQYASHADVLILRQNAFGAALGTVVNEVVAVPHGAARTHLGQPRPDIMGRPTNRDGVVDGSEGLRNKGVSGKSPGLLVRSWRGSACCSRSLISPSLSVLRRMLAVAFLHEDIKHYDAPLGFVGVIVVTCVCTANQPASSTWIFNSR